MHRRQDPALLEWVSITACVCGRASFESFVRPLRPEEIARDWCVRTGIPYLGRADIGHDAANKVVPFGLHRAG